MLCTKCGVQNAENVKFCKACGSAIADKPNNAGNLASPPSQPAVRQSTKPINKALFAIPGVIILAVAAVFLLLPGDGSVGGADSGNNVTPVLGSADETGSSNPVTSTDGEFSNDVAAPPTALRFGRTFSVVGDSFVFIDNSGDLWEVNSGTNERTLISAGNNLTYLLDIPLGYAIDNQNNLWDLYESEIIASNIRYVGVIGSGAANLLYLNNANELMFWTRWPEDDLPSLLKNSVRDVLFFNDEVGLIWGVNTDGTLFGMDNGTLFGNNDFRSFRWEGEENGLNVTIPPSVFGGAGVERIIFSQRDFPWSLDYLIFALTSDRNLWNLEENSIVLENVVDIQHGSDWSVIALTANGSLYTVFENGRHITPALIMENVQSFISFVDSIFSISVNNDLYAWGNNEFGQLGDGTTTDRNTPTMVLENVARILPWGHYTNAIKTNGELWAWGSNERGQLGDTVIDRLNPVFIMDNVAYSNHYFMWDDRSFALLTNGELWAWGDTWRATHLSPIFVADNVRIPPSDYDFIRNFLDIIIRQLRW
ncbi:MAG: zinc-ribbon domain-containing protein [Turicibacter sp.]|nr:zinc-ribbon domain-containing protein [Turicibacter sp.]